MTLPAPTLDCVVLDCPDTMALAAFYAELLSWSIDDDSDANWATVRGPRPGVSLGFQHDPDFRPSTWPEPQRPQMLHLDLDTTDMDADHERALSLGAKPLPSPEHDRFRVYADPAGHPFCLCRA